MAAKKKAAGKRQGVIAGGNFIIDQVKMIDVWPQRHTLANISSQSEGSGGAPYNVLLDLAKMGAKFPLAAAGSVGKDKLGEQILADCKAHKVDTKFLKPHKSAPTSYTDVMTEEAAGDRTFFHMRGANASWTGSDIDFKKSNYKIFHLGYLLLLDAMDAPDAKHGTKAAALLKKARDAGLKTSIDCVSEDSDRFNEIVPPALEHTDYCVINEFEAGKITGYKLRDEKGNLDTVFLRHAAGAILQKGVQELVAIHFPEGGFCRTRDGRDHWQMSLKLPQKYIQGTAGAGDAFCAGFLYGIHQDQDLQDCLLNGVCAAAASLSDSTCTGGMKSLTACLALKKKYRPRPPLEPEW
ncbi:MAG: ribokinase [Verrucomicrobiales bacterium]|nr:ribokinase [Verrucomicrobiales bacterium]|tara:strand:- start:9339 stop:10394 length:1056 start_codon:yes stop_codon:yes gene_type:complete